MYQFYTLLQTNFVTSADILCNFMYVLLITQLCFFIYALMMFSKPLRMIKTETCRSYEKLFVKYVSALLVLLCEIFVDARTLII